MTGTHLVVTIRHYRALLALGRLMGAMHACGALSARDAVTAVEWLAEHWPKRIEIQ
jgi:hypothetical protein